jgi:hypothetical protein
LKIAKCTYPTGDIYVGEWKEGLTEGKGEKNDLMGGDTYVYSSLENLTEKEQNFKKIR